MQIRLFEISRKCLEEKELDTKLRISSQYSAEIIEAELDYTETVTESIEIGRPDKPSLVSPSKLSRRGFSSIEQRLALAHAIAHIEFNAINLAWDAIWRFKNMPEDYYRDWASVAADETRHFMALRRYLEQHGCDYGDYDAHDGLWTMAEKTSADVLDRMAIVPRVLEARGLDVTPAMIDKCVVNGDSDLADIFMMIYKEEIQHVRIGNKWYGNLCRERSLDPLNTFLQLVKTYGVMEKTSTINEEARILAGFSAVELDAIKNL